MANKTANEIIRMAEEGSRKFIAKANKRIAHNIRKANESGVNFNEERKRLVKTSN